MTRYSRDGRLSGVVVGVVALCGALLALSGCPRPGGQGGQGTVPVQPTELDKGAFQATLNGFDIHYEVHGSGPVVMVLPNAWGITCDALRGLFGGLEKQLTMVYFEPRGMGASAAVREPSDMSLAAVRADFLALQRHLGLAQVNAFGWSNGAYNLVLLAAESPGSLRSAIFAHGLASFSAEDGQAYAERYPATVQSYGELRALLQRDDVTDEDKDRALKDLWLSEFLPGSCADASVCTPMLRQVFGDMRFRWRHATYATREAALFDRTPLLPRIVMPTLVIAGVHDTVPVAKAEEMHAGLPDSRLLVLEHSGHFAPLEQAAEFERAVFAFLGAE